MTTLTAIELVEVAGVPLLRSLIEMGIINSLKDLAEKQAKTLAAKAQLAALDSVKAGVDLLKKEEQDVVYSLISDLKSEGYDVVLPDGYVATTPTTPTPDPNIGTTTTTDPNAAAATVDPNRLNTAPPVV